jgi:DNA-binding LacI/PurR family transcriptional regulator
MQPRLGARPTLLLCTIALQCNVWLTLPLAQCQPPRGAPSRPRWEAAIRTKDKATSLVIAHLAGVSQPTVSRALRGSPMVNEATRSRILKIARELNYTVDKNASNLRCQHSGTLALLFFEDPAPDDSLINPFFVSMLASITRACARRGYDLLISFQQPANNDWQASFEDSNKADGIILLGYGDYLDYRARLEFLNARGIHFVRWGAIPLDQPEVSVGCDNRRGGYDATAHLFERGCRRIAFLGDASDHYPEFLERYRGYAAALEAHDLPADAKLQVDAISSEQSGFDAANVLLERKVRFDAICAASDLIAIGAMKALHAHGLRVPDDVLITGFDDIPLAGFVNPSLTTVQQDTKAAGALLVDTLLKRIHNEPVENQILPVSLIVRRSTERPTVS